MHNQQDSEIFENIARSWWDLDGPCKTLHDINPTRLEYIKQQTNLEKKNVADIGCGGGILSEALALNKASVTGLDISSKLISVAQDHSKHIGSSIYYTDTTLEALAEERKASYDLVIAMELVEHVKDINHELALCTKLLKENGILIISTLNRNIISFALGIVAAEYILKIVPQGTHQYENFVKPAELACYCRGNGLEMTDISGIAYNPFLRNAKLVKNTAINYIATFKKT